MIFYVSVHYSITNGIFLDGWIKGPKYQTQWHLMLTATLNHHPKNNFSLPYCPMVWTINRTMEYVCNSLPSFQKQLMRVTNSTSSLRASPVQDNLLNHLFDDTKKKKSLRLLELKNNFYHSLIVFLIKLILFLCWFVIAKIVPQVMSKN